MQVETRSLRTEPLASQHLEVGEDSGHSFPVSSGFSSDTLLFLIGQVEFKWEFFKWRVHAGCWKSAENLGRRYTWWLLWMVGMEATVRVHCAGGVPGFLVGKRLTDPQWRQRSKKECEEPQNQGRESPMKENVASTGLPLGNSERRGLSGTTTH